jgi:hypothetical protein
MLGSHSAACSAVARIVALGVAMAACGPSLIGGDGSSTSEADTTATMSTSVSATADDGPITTPGTNNTTSPDPTTVATSMTDTATATDPTADGDDDSGDAEEGFFLDGGFDGGGHTIECDVLDQDCPEGEKCMPWANDGGPRWNATRCSPLAPAPNSVGESCTVEGSAVSGIDDCEIAAMCWDVDPNTNQGTCVAMCTGPEIDPACADDSGTECMVQYHATVTLCLPLCDPRLQDCSALAECVPSDDAFFCVPDQSGAEGQYADGCSEFDACDPGLFCANAELVPSCVDSGCCTEFCDLALPDPNMQCTGNADGVQCLPWYEEGSAPAGYELLGVCVLPS